MISQRIEHLRGKAGLSQDDIARALKVSRSTYIKIEKGDISPTIDQLRALSRLYEVELDYFVGDYPEKSQEPEVHREKASVNTVKQANDEAIEVPTEDRDKFKQVLLYVLNKVGAKPNVGETALYKLLYFIDFDYFEKYQERLTGARYIRNHFGPTPTSFKDIVNEMVTNNELDITTGDFFKYKQRKYMPRVKPDLSRLNAQEVEHIDEELARLSDKTAAELTDLSHRDIPWRVAKDRQVVDYMSVFYRSSETSVREHSNDPL